MPALSAPLTRSFAIERTNSCNVKRRVAYAGSVKQRMKESGFRVGRQPPTAVHVLVACIVLSGALPLLLPVDFAPRCAGKLRSLTTGEKDWRGHAAKACHPALRWQWQRQHVFDRLKTQTLFIQQAYSRPGRNKVIYLCPLTAAKEAGGTTGRLPRHPPTHAIAAGIRHTMTK